MELVPSFAELLQRLAPVFTVPTFHSFLVVRTGWVFARRRVVTRMIEAADAVKTPGHRRRQNARPPAPSGRPADMGADTTARFTVSFPPPAGRWTNSAWRSSN